MIASPVGANNSIVEHGVNGYLVTPGDVKELTDAILKLLTNTEEINRMSQEARAMSEQYSVDGYVQTLQHWYSELAAGRTSAV